MLMFEERKEGCGRDVSNEETDEKDETGFARVAGHHVSVFLGAESGIKRKIDFIESSLPAFSRAE